MEENATLELARQEWLSTIVRWANASGTKLTPSYNHEYFAWQQFLESQKDVDLDIQSDSALSAMLWDEVQEKFNYLLKMYADKESAWSNMDSVKASFDAQDDDYSSFKSIWKKLVAEKLKITDLARNDDKLTLVLLERIKIKKQIDLNEMQL